MSEEYYVDLNGHTAGPFTIQQMRDLYAGRTITDQTIYSTPKSVEWLPVSVISPLLAAAMVPPAVPGPPPGQPPDARPFARKHDWVCTLCGYVGRPRYQTQGSFAVELLLWILFCAPGLIYSVWRLVSKKKICPSCGSAAIIPASSTGAAHLVRVR
jgi:rubredoxin